MSKFDKVKKQLLQIKENAAILEGGGRRRRKANPFEKKRLGLLFQPKLAKERATIEKNGDSVVKILENIKAYYPRRFPQIKRKTIARLEQEVDYPVNNAFLDCLRNENFRQKLCKTPDGEIEEVLRECLTLPQIAKPVAEVHEAPINISGEAQLAHLAKVAANDATTTQQEEIKELKSKIEQKEKEISKLVNDHKTLKSTHEVENKQISDEMSRIEVEKRKLKEEKRELAVLNATLKGKLATLELQRDDFSRRLDMVDQIIIDEERRRENKNNGQLKGGGDVVSKLIQRINQI